MARAPPWARAPRTRWTWRAGNVHDVDLDRLRGPLAAKLAGNEQSQR